mgnify:FL=1|jgi:hypothetical protein
MHQVEAVICTWHYYQPITGQAGKGYPLSPLLASHGASSEDAGHGWPQTAMHVLYIYENPTPVILYSTTARYFSTNYLA